MVFDREVCTSIKIQLRGISFPATMYLFGLGTGLTTQTTEMNKHQSIFRSDMGVSLFSVRDFALPAPNRLLLKVL